MRSPSEGSADMTTRAVRAATGHEPSSKQRSRLHAEPIIFAGVVLLQLVPLAIMPYVIATDGPSHVAGAWVLGHYSDADSALQRQYYQIDFLPSPNMLTELLLAGLMRIVSPAAAEKLLVAGYLVAFPCAVRYAVRSINHSAGWLGFLALPLTFNYLFFSGFYNFCYGVALSIFTMAFVWRHRRRWDLWSSVVLALLLLLTYGTHLLPFAMTLLFITAMVAWDALPEARRQRRSGIPWSSVAGNLASIFHEESDKVIKRRLTPLLTCDDACASLHQCNHQKVRALTTIVAGQQAGRCPS